MKVQCFMVGIAIGALLMAIIAKCYVNDLFIHPMRSLGIEGFRKCEINTTNCHSNWYEIVYKDRK